MKTYQNILSHQLKIKILKNFYSNDLIFIQDELIELINILSFLNNKYLIDALYLSKYNEYDISHLLNPDLEQMLSDIKYESLLSFVKNGCIICIKYFLIELLKYYSFNNIFQTACENNQLDIAKYLISLENTHDQINR